jgi:hypothetical protein
MTMTIEILYFHGCPNYLPAVERVQKALEVERVSAEVKHVEVPDAETAAARGFLGSPTIRVNGLDVEPQARSGGAVGLCCRTYADAAVRDGAPSTELIREAIRQVGAGGGCCV